MLIYGVNPVVEVLTSGGTMRRLLLAEGAKVHDLERILSLAAAAGLRVQRVRRDEIERLAPGAVHQGVIAEIEEAKEATLAQLLARAEGAPPLLLALDQIQDPIHLGAALRCAHAFGAQGVIIPKDRAVTLTPTAFKASAGAASHVPIARVTNLVRALEELKEAGVWCHGAAMDGEPADQTDLTGPACLVIGSEGSGLRPLVRKTCDRVISIPMGRSGVGSLSASVAAGVLLYELDRQRRTSARSS